MTAHPLRDAIKAYLKKNPDASAKTIRKHLGVKPSAQKKINRLVSSIRKQSKKTHLPQKLRSQKLSKGGSQKRPSSKQGLKTNRKPKKTGPAPNHLHVCVVKSIQTHGYVLVSLWSETRFLCFLPKIQNFKAKQGLVMLVNTQSRTRSSRNKKRYRSKLPPVSWVQTFGHIDDPLVDQPALLASNNIQGAFPENCLKEAKHSLTQALDPLEAQRMDLRDLPFCTIDGADAKDFDDAVAFDGTHLWVAVADVSHYVKAGSELDHVAAFRGNSFYFPNHVVPMLPEALSNEACSLNPNQDRYVFACRWMLNSKKGPVDFEVFPGIIRSQARLTYAEVDQWLESSNPEDQDSQKSKKHPLHDMILKLHAISARLKKQRLATGGLHLNLRESQIYLKPNGHIEKIKTRKSSDATSLIEELMLLANRHVAKHIFEQSKSDKHINLFRTHPDPSIEKLKHLYQTMRALPHTAYAKHTIPALPGTTPPNNELLPTLTHLLKTLQPSHQTIFSYQILRCMSQANYETQLKPHFGLGFHFYTHFTSPIRRYADLLIHRRLRKHWLGHAEDHQRPSPLGSLETCASHLNIQERVAQSMERDFKKLKCIRHAIEHKDQAISVWITSIIQKGMFCEDPQTGTEGLLAFSHLKSLRIVDVDLHRQRVSLAKGRTLHLGDALRVKPFKINLVRKQLDWGLADDAFSTSRTKRPSTFDA